jgi:serine/threonine-protein kinase
VNDPVAGATTDAAPAPLATPAFAPGARVAGRYRLESRLGAGGGGTVWRCTDERLAMTVALKIVGADGELERWRREVAMARRIADRNVCRVHDLGEADGVRFVTMELVDGVGLRAKLAAGLPFAEARDLFAQVVSGVAAIHAAGVVHRDLKPDNIVVASDGRAVIVDFGLAREPRAPHDVATGAVPASPHALSTTLTHEGAIVGTPRYMSPEQAAGELVDARTDVWALGLIGHELLTGKLPPPSDDGRSRVVDAAALAGWPAIAGVLRKCLAVTPDDRYPDARAVLAALPTNPRAIRRGLIAAAAVVALGGALGLGIQLARDDASTPVQHPIDAAVAPVDLPPPQLRQLVDSAFSIAAAPDGKSYAYTTPEGRLFVAPLAGGPPREWKLSPIEQREGSKQRQSALVTSWCAGWFSDHSVVLSSIAETGTWHLVRVFEDGRQTVLYSSTERFTASAAGDIAAIGMHESGVFVVRANKPEELEQIERIGNGEIVMALAVSPDGSRVAVARRPTGKPEAQLQIVTLAGDASTVWKGQVVNDIDQMVAWLDDNRVAFIHREEQRSTLYTRDLRTTRDIPRKVWPSNEYAGIGSAAKGELFIVGGRLAHGVGIGGPRAERLAAAHDVNATASLPAGWTPDGALVFALDDQAGVSRVVRVVPGGLPETWPGLTGGERPNAVLGDAVIVHRTEGADTVIERVTARGTRKELHRMPAVDARYVVRCAGEREKPCFIEEAGTREVTWRLFYPSSGEVGRLLHKRLRREVNMQTAALSPDGKTLAIVEGTSELLLVDVETTSVRTIDVGLGAELQTVAFEGDGSLWATSMGYRGQFFALLRFPRLRDHLSTEATDVVHGPSRFFWRPTPSPDGKRLALGLIDFHLVIWHLAGV